MEDLNIIFATEDHHATPSETQLGVSSPTKKDVRFVLSSASHPSGPPSPPGPDDDDSTLRLSHGPTQVFNIPISDGVSCAVFNQVTRLLLIADGNGMVHFVSEAGRTVDVYRMGYPVTNLLCLADGCSYIGWVPGEPQLVVTTDDMKKTCSVVCDQPVVDVIYNSLNIMSADTKDVVSRWSMAASGRGLSLKQKLPLLEPHKECASSGTLVSCLAVGFEDKVCYAAVDRDVAEVNFNMGTVQYLHFKSKSKITAMVALRQHKLLVTGSKRGVVKVWSLSGELMSLFYGHSNDIIALAPCPLPKTVMSSSLDRTVRFWKLDAVNEFSRLSFMSVVKAFLSGDSRTNQFFLVSNLAVSMWTVEELYTSLATLRSTIRFIGHVSLEMLTPYIPVCLANQSAFVINLLSGEIMAAVKVAVDLQDIALCQTEELLFLLVQDGFSIIRAWSHQLTAKSKPWKMVTVVEPLTCLMAYERRAKGVMTSDYGCAQLENTSLALLFAGRSDAAITWLNMSTCQPIGLVKGHAGSILRLACCTSVGRLVSLGQEKVVELWQVLPSEEQLLVSLYCLHPQVDLAPIIAVARHSVAVAAVKGLFMYHFNLKRFILPQPQLGPGVTIQHVVALETLQIYATAVSNKTVCIWSECNQLLRIVCLDHIPAAIAFSSCGGDIVFSCKNYLFRLPANRYLPKDLLFVSRKIMLHQLGIAELSPATVPLSRSCVSDSSVGQDAMMFGYHDQYIWSPKSDTFKTQLRRESDVSELNAYAESVAGILFLSTMDSSVFSKRSYVFSSREGQVNQCVTHTSKHFFPMKSTSCPSNCFYNTDNVRGGLIPNSILVKILWPDMAWTDMTKPVSKPELTESEPKILEENGAMQVIGRRLQEVAFVRCTTLGCPDDGERMQVVHVLLMRRPSVMKEADISWLPDYEQSEILFLAGEDWKVIRVKVVYGMVAKATLRKVGKVFYSSPKEKDYQPSQAGRSLIFAPKIVDHALSLKLGFDSPTSENSCVSKVKPSTLSTETGYKLAAKGSDTKTNDGSGHHLLLPRNEDSVVDIAKSMKEFIKFLSRCANAIRLQRCSKKEVAVALNVLGVYDPEGVLIEELEDWVQEVKDQFTRDKTSILQETIESWLKRWTVRYISHVLALVQELRRGQMRGHVRLNMLQFILDHNKGQLVATAPQDTTLCGLREDSPLADVSISLAVSSPATLDQSLLDKVTPVEVVNYFCEVCSDQRQCYCENGLLDDVNLKSVPICSTSSTLKYSSTFKEVSTPNVFGPWPTAVHLPLKTANVVMFRDKMYDQSAKLLSYQTCNKFFVHNNSY